MIKITKSKYKTVRDIVGNYKRYDSSSYKKYKLNYEIVNFILSSFNQLIVDDIVKDGLRFEMGYGLGDLRLSCRNTNGNCGISYSKSRKYGLRVKNLYDCTGFKQFRIHWSKSKLKNISFYTFRRNKKLEKLMFEYIENTKGLTKHF